MKVLPIKISRYIKKHFQEGHRLKSKRISAKKETIIVDVTEDEAIHKLVFSKAGKLISHEKGSA